MIINLYCIYDAVADEYGPIFTGNNDNVARRCYFNLIEKERVNVNDYTLWYLGNYNNETAIIDPKLIEVKTKEATNA